MGRMFREGRAMVKQGGEGQILEVGLEILLLSTVIPSKKGCFC